MKKQSAALDTSFWVLEGMQRFRLTEAMRAYQEGQVDLGQAAQQARLPIAILLEEMAARKVAILEDPDAFGAGFDVLYMAFAGETTTPEPPNA